MKIGNYTLGRTIPGGSMGVVYEAFDLKNNIVALKTISTERFEPFSYTDIERFRREAETMSKLNHPNIAKYHDIGFGEMTDGQGNKTGQSFTFIVMEFIGGQSLKDYLSEKKCLSLGEALALTIQILVALEAIHKIDGVHRDIKPGNIMREPNGNVKVIDFGLVRLKGSTLTPAGLSLGTPRFKSPEQARGEHVDLRSDLFSCAVVFYQLITGKYAFDGTSQVVVEGKIKTQTPTIASQLVNTIPTEVDEILKKALEKSPGDRYQTAGEFINALNGIKI